MASAMNDEANPRKEASTTRWTPVEWLKELFTENRSLTLLPFLIAVSVPCFSDESAPVEMRLRHVGHSSTKASQQLKLMEKSFSQGRRKWGARRDSAPAWILTFSEKKGCFLSFEWEKSNFTTFGHPLDKFRKKPLVAAPWKKSFRRPCLQWGFQDVFEALFLATYRTSAMKKFSIKKLLWIAVTGHPLDVTSPSDLCLVY